MYMSFWHIAMCVGHFNKIFVGIASKVGKRIEPNLSGKHLTVYIDMDDVFNFPEGVISICKSVFLNRISLCIVFCQA